MTPTDLRVLRERLYAALKHEKSCVCGECSGGLNAVDAIVRQCDAAREAIRVVWEACPNYGSEGCTCGNQATPDRNCRVHWAVECLERNGFGYHQTQAATKQAANE